MSGPETRLPSDSRRFAFIFPETAQRSSLFAEALEKGPGDQTQMGLWKGSSEAGKEVSLWFLEVKSGQAGLQAQLGPHGGCKCW